MDISIGTRGVCRDWWEEGRGRRKEGCRRCTSSCCDAGSSYDQKDVGGKMILWKMHLPDEPKEVLAYNINTDRMQKAIRRGYILALMDTTAVPKSCLMSFSFASGKKHIVIAEDYEFIETPKAISA
jgi:hypothetical protein